MNRRAAFEVVDRFEQALCEYTGAPYCVTVDSCTNAIYLALRWWKEISPDWQRVHLPKHTYIGVVHAAKNAGFEVEFTKQKWQKWYQISPFALIDSAKHFERNMYHDAKLSRKVVCLSFQAGKLLPIGRGGAILTEHGPMADWLRKARLDGRTQGADYHNPTFQKFGTHCYMTPPDAARGLWLLTYIDDNDTGTWTEYPDLSQAIWT